MKNKSLLITIVILIIAMSSAAQETGSFIDSRDGRNYKTIKIGTQTWMAENLNYTIKDSSWCYDDSSNCHTYGRLYTWGAVKIACPAGWHLPTYDEWKTLIKYLGGDSVAGKKMKSTSGWKGNGNGTNNSGFSALPGGCRFDIFDGAFYNAGIFGCWWSATEFDILNAWSITLYYKNDLVYRHRYEKSYGFSVRCIRD